MRLKKTITRELKEEQLKPISQRSIIHSKKLQTDGTYLVEYTIYNMSSYETIVNQLVKEKYSDSEEFALINKGIADNNNDEYIEYRNFVANCKKIAREFIEERQTLLGR